MTNAFICDSPLGLVAMVQKTIDLDGEKVRITKMNGSYNVEELAPIDQFVEFCSSHPDVDDWSVNSHDKTGAMKFNSDDETDIDLYSEDIPGEINRIFTKPVYDYDFYVKFTF